MIYPGMLAVVACPGYDAHIMVRDISNTYDSDHPAVKLTMPMIVLTYLRSPPPRWKKTGDHNVMLLGSNGVIGWLPEEWVKPC